MATVTSEGWSNATNTSNESCICDSWKDHWIKHSKKSWPTECSVKDCTETPTLGAHVKNPAITGNRIVPMCDGCNQLTGTFSMPGVTFTNADTDK